MPVVRDAEKAFLRRVIQSYFAKVRVTPGVKEEVYGLLSAWRMQGWNGALKEIADLYREHGDTELAELYEEMWAKYAGR